jgi:NTE family protein
VEATSSEQQTVQELSFNVDSLDSVAFPTRGTLFSLDWQRGLHRAEAAPVPTRQSVQWLEAFRAGRWAGHVYGEWARSQGGASDNNLGGFLRLSGTTPNSVVGSRTVLGRMVIARSIGAMPAALGGDVRLGFSLEAGAAYSPSNPLHWGSIKQAASALSRLIRVSARCTSAAAPRGTARAAPTCSSDRYSNYCCQLLKTNSRL